MADKLINQSFCSDDFIRSYKKQVINLLIMSGQAMIYVLNKVLNKKQTPLVSPVSRFLMKALSPMGFRI